jgi:hypothetical protein
MIRKYSSARQLAPRKLSHSALCALIAITLRRRGIAVNFPELLEDPTLDALAKPTA